MISLRILGRKRNTNTVNVFLCFPSIKALTGKVEGHHRLRVIGTSRQKIKC